MRSANEPQSDLTARARIRDAALALFGRQGYAGTGMRAIAVEAGVSPALVVHHFGSKEGLRQACDEYVTSRMRITKEQAMTQGPPDPLEMFRTAEEAQPLLRYLARMLGDGSPGVAQVVDTMVSDAVDYMEKGVGAGFLRPTEQPYERAVLLCIWQLGAVALHEHVKRLLGIDLLADREAMLVWGRPALEVLTHGIFTDERWEEMVAEAAPRRRNDEPKPRREASDER